MEKSRETRIGLVMYGGVSLAVYINGVSQEFYHAVQGNGVYRLIKELTDSEIVLDILSGSSAGGINGILLSYALCNKKDFTRCADLWRNAADIRRLLRPAFHSDAPVRSVLDSEGYYQTELEHAFRTLDASPARAESPSPVKELDLFITGTDIDGRVHARVDDAGHTIEVKDHRAVFHLKHREGRKSNFDATRNPAVVIALSKLARITSCFPGAFAPVFVSHSSVERKSPDRMSANELLQYWGALPNAAYLIDGGVIDNKPFTHTIREIFFRTTERKVDRRLYYVEPDPERFPQSDDGAGPAAPSFLKPIVNSLVAIPGYESITDDLNLLATRNENIRAYKRVLQDVGKACAFTSHDYGVDVPAELPEPQRSIYLRARFASLSQRVLQGVFRNATLENSPQISARRAELIQEFDRRTASSPQTLRDFDVLFRLRRVFHLIYYVYGLLYEPSETPVSEEKAAAYRELLKALNQKLELLNVLDSAMEQIVDEIDYGWRDTEQNAAPEVWNRVNFSLRQLLHADNLSPHVSDLNALNGALRTRIDQCRANLYDISGFSSVLLRTDNLELALLDQMLGPEDPVRKRYYAFNSIDAHLFPIEWVSGLREKDIVEVCRVSPVDAQRGFSNRPAQEKTAGDTLGHFSAFFKRTWRSNDILWGRLDAVCELVETLLTPKQIADAMSREPVRRRAREALLPGEGAVSPLDDWFRDSSETAVNRMKSWVADITSEVAAERERALEAFTAQPDPEAMPIRDLLIEMAQFRVLHECLPQMFEDSIREQVEWKRVRRRRRNDPTRLEWLGTDVAVDGAALEALAAVGGKKLVEELSGGRPLEESPRNSKLGQAFATFRVGSEDVLGGGVPPLVLAEILSKALLVLRNCLLGSVSTRTANRIRASAVYRWGIDYPLRVFHGAVVFLKSAPAVETGILAGLTVLSVLAVLVGIRWKEAIIQPQGQFNALWFAVFIALPAGFLLAATYQFVSFRLSRRRLSSRIRHAVAALCAAAPLISVVLLYFGLTDVVMDWWIGTSAPAESRDIQFLMIVVYGIIPFALSFAGGYLALLRNSRRPQIEDYRGALERITDSELQDVADRMDQRFRVTPENRLDIVKALSVAAEMNAELGKLDRAIRASSPGALEG